jgi:hypothetical protein
MVFQAEIVFPQNEKYEYVFTHFVEITRRTYVNIYDDPAKTIANPPHSHSLGCGKMLKKQTIVFSRYFLQMFFR